MTKHLGERLDDTKYWEDSEMTTNRKQYWELLAVK